MSWHGALPLSSHHHWLNGLLRFRGNEGKCRLTQVGPLALQISHIKQENAVSFQQFSSSASWNNYCCMLWQAHFHIKQHWFSSRECVGKWLCTGSQWLYDSALIESPGQENWPHTINLAFSLSNMCLHFIFHYMSVSNLPARNCPALS